MFHSPWIIKDRPIKIGVVGCGRISVKHIEAIQQLEGFETVALVDSQTEALKTGCEKFNIHGFETIEAMLEQTEVDAVTLCTPSGLHPSQTKKIAKAGRHVITEKPMATRFEDGAEMVKICDEAGVRLFVVKQNRHNATLQRLKKAIQDGRFGNIYMIQVNVFWTRPQSYYDQAAWRGTWEYDGGALMNQASHYIDLLHWLNGPVDSVQCMAATLARKIETEDTATLNVKWRSGTLGSVAVTMLTYPKNLEGSITILGEKGSARVGGVAVNEIEHWEFDTMLPEDKEVTASSYETNSVYGFGHPLYYQNVLDVFHGKALPETDGREGLKSLELLIAAYRSQRDGGTVALPLML